MKKSSAETVRKMAVPSVVRPPLREARAINAAALTLWRVRRLKEKTT